MPVKTILKTGGHDISVTNGEKVLFPDDGLTKKDLAEYYSRISGVMMSYIEGRPLTMVRYPEGIQKEGFFQKSASSYFPSWIKRASMTKYGGSTPYVIADNPAVLVYLASQNCVTQHIWLSRADRPHYPDMMIFDLDPSDNDFEPVRQAAFALRELLTGFGLAVYVKTTGSRGLHITVPLDRSADFDGVRAFAERTAFLMVSHNPEQLTTEQRKDKRGDKVFIDTMRNSYNQTAVAPYTARALPGAPVAAPLDWEELKDTGFSPQQFTITNIFTQPGRKLDPWEGFQNEARGIEEARKKLDKIIQ